jgi:RimJ/RimL family protein N-acetyltransferase
VSVALTTPRLLLRPSRKEDAPAFYKLMQLNYGRLKDAFPKSTAASSSVASCAAYLEKLRKEGNEKIIYHFLVLHENELIGMLYLKNIDWTVPKCELAYFISQEREGKGFVKEAVKALVKYCFDELLMNKLFIRTSVSNKRSAGLALAAGFEKEGTMKQDFRSGNGELQDVDYFGLVRKSPL